MTTAHRGLAEGGPLALRYPEEIAPFAALGETEPDAYDALTALIPRSGRVALFTPDRLSPSSRLSIQHESPIVQMIHRTEAPAVDAMDRVVPLGPADVVAMLQLVELTKPGPFARRTHEIGGYFGIRESGELVAMAGERFRLPGHVEISAVCVHPAHRGRGFARILTRTLVSRIARGGARPILHVFATNTSAITLYEGLGFERRRNLYVTLLQHS